VDSEILILENFHNKLNTLLDNNHLSKTIYNHFKERGLESFSFKDYCSFYKYFPIGIPLSVSEEYLNKMTVPDQNTSYVMAKAQKDRPEYIFNIPGFEGGGVSNLTSGSRSVVDNLAATLSAIFFGYHATTITLGNWMANSTQVWKEGFFLVHLPPKLKEEALAIKKKFFDHIGAPEEPYLVVGIRSKSSLNNLFSSKIYKKKHVATLNPKNGIKMIFITSNDVKHAMLKELPESEHVSYIDTGEIYDIYKGMLSLRKYPYKIKKMLNDGGAEYSNHLVDLKLLSGQRITKMPWPGSGFIPENVVTDYPKSVLGYDGASELDGSEIKNSIEVFSQEIPSQRQGLKENVNVYLHELDEKKIL